jgi:vesicle-fusing ATPase
MLDDFHSEKELFNINPFHLEKMGIGGLGEEFITLFRRAFITRLMPPSLMKKLKLKHVKGVLLYGPTGTGKTLIARKIGEMLNCKPPKIINGPEILNKFVGESEKNIRALFTDAEAEQNEKGDQSGLHLLIFDEFDSLCKKRGMSSDNTGVGDNIVNQLLSKIDGVDSLNNVLLIGMTNRKDLIDDAILRPGRFEVHIQISLPDENGRNEILRIHTNNMKENKMLDQNVNLELLAKKTKNFSGAELEGLVKSATTYALQRHTDIDNPSQLIDVQSMVLKQDDFLKALTDITPAFGNDLDEILNNVSNEIINYGPKWKNIDDTIYKYVKNFIKNDLLSTFRLLLNGDTGCGKTTISKYIAKILDYPYVKVIHPSLFVGFSETMKINTIKKIFMDAYQSINSIIIIDDFERLIEFSEYGRRYSNNVLQTLLVLINQNTKNTNKNKLFIIGTCKNIEIIKELELYDIFDANINIPNIDNVSIEYICNHYNKDKIESSNIPIKKIINKLLIE